jgi:putative salt-induced outer membrane protein
MIGRNSSALLLSMFFATNAVAEESVERAWKSDAEVGGVVTRGNTRTQSINAKLSVLHEREKWRHEGKLETFKASDRTATTAEKYIGSGKTDYKYSARNYAFATVKYENDRFSGYEYQATEAIGYGRRIAKTMTFTLDFEGGVGARQSKEDDGHPRNKGILRFAGNMSWALSPTSVFTEQLTVEYGVDATVTTSITALKAKINDDLAMKLSFTIKNTSETPPAIESTDTQSAVTLVYALL